MTGASLNSLSRARRRSVARLRRSSSHLQMPNAAATTASDSTAFFTVSDHSLPILWPETQNTTSGLIITTNNNARKPQNASGARQNAEATSLSILSSIVDRSSSCGLGFEVVFIAVSDGGFLVLKAASQFLSLVNANSWKRPQKKLRHSTTGAEFVPWFRPGSTSGCFAFATGCPFGSFASRDA